VIVVRWGSGRVIRGSTDIDAAWELQEGPDEAD
jgi:hypothetical protein